MAGNTIDGPFKHLTAVEAYFMDELERGAIVQAASAIILANHTELHNSPRGLADEIDALTGIDTDEALFWIPESVFQNAA